MISEINQISFFELACEKKVAETQPLLEIGQTVHIVEYDMIFTDVIEQNWICGCNTENPYFGYSVHQNGTVWDKELGSRLFTDYEKAQEKANKNSLSVVKIMPDKLNLFEPRCFEYTRNRDSYTLTAFIAKVDELKLYEQKFYCYHFLHSFKSVKERDTEYQKLVLQSEKECKNSCGVEVVNPCITKVTEPLYWVSDNLFASWRYAKSNSMKNNKGDF